MNAIDLGLPSGTLWADKNLGANTASDPGNYYAWGEKEPKNEYTTATHSLYKGVEVEDQEQPDNEAVAQSEDVTEAPEKKTHIEMRWMEGFEDPCSELGEGWQTPSAADFLELIENTTQTVVTIRRNKYLRFEAPGGEFIQLPLAGYKDDSSEIHFELPTGEYWASDEYESLIEEGGYAVRLCIGSEGICNLYEQHKSLGLSIRPIQKIK